MNVKGMGVWRGHQSAQNDGIDKLGQQDKSRTWSNKDTRKVKDVQNPGQPDKEKGRSEGRTSRPILKYWLLPDPDSGD